MNDMKTTQPNVRWLSYSSILLGILGFAFFWWAPLGMVLNLAGLMIGFVDWNAVRRRSLDNRLSIVGMAPGAAAFIFNCVIVYLGMQTVTFGGP